MVTKVQAWTVLLPALGLLAACHAKSSGSDDRDSGGSGAVVPGAGIHLPTCAADGPVFTQLPHALDDLRSLVPLGHLAPSPHTFPTDHMYFFFAGGTAAPLVSPGDLTVTRVAATDYLSATPPYSDYAVTFRPCQEVEIYFGHVKTLDPEFLAKLGGIDSTFCLSYTSGGQPMRYCDQPANFAVSAGEIIGTAGSDLGAKDARVPPLDYANTSDNAPSPDGLDTLHSVCPLDYFRADLKTELQGLIGDIYGVARTTQPWCGAIMQDIRGTVQGRWFALGATRPGPEDPNLALVHDNDWNTTREVFSVGTSASASGLATGTYFFHPVSTGNVNRDFKDVTADGAIYCYEQFSGVVAKGVEEAIASQTLLLQLVSSTTLRMERREAVTCASIGTWSFDDQATDFER
jgi:hypothetical protein